MTSKTAAPEITQDPWVCEPTQEQQQAQELLDHLQQDAPCEKVAKIEQWKAKRVAKVREGLKGRHCVAVYRETARKSANVTDLEFRILDALLSFSNQLKNCFPGRQALLQRLGGRKRTLRALSRTCRSLEQKQWIVLGELYGENEADNLRQPATGYVFRVPPNEIAPGDPGFPGPKDFDNRIWRQNAAPKLAT